MFIFTAKVRRSKLVAVAAVLLCGSVVLAGFLLSRGTAVGVSANVKGIKSPEDRITYLEKLGWQVSPDPLAVEELLIPQTFDESYGEYLALQEGQGFDLTKYQGKRVKRYTYLVTNYPSGETGVQVSLLVYKTTIIGGDVLSPKLGGFLHGLSPQTAVSPAPSTVPSPSPSAVPSAKAL